MHFFCKDYSEIYIYLHIALLCILWNKSNCFRSNSDCCCCNNIKAEILKYIFIIKNNTDKNVCLQLCLVYFSFCLQVCKTIWVTKLSALINWWRRRRRSVVRGKSPWVWGQISQVASCTLDHKAARECWWLRHKAREAEICASQAVCNFTRSTVSTTFLQTHARQYLCDDSWQFRMCVCVRVSPLFCFKRGENKS